MGPAWGSNSWCKMNAEGRLVVVLVVIAQNLPQIQSKMALAPAKSSEKKPLHCAIMFVWMLYKTNISPLRMNHNGRDLSGIGIVVFSVRSAF